MMTGSDAHARGDVILEASRLKVHFPVRRRTLLDPRLFVHAVDGIDLKIPNGSSFGIVGESGSGKTTAALAMIRLVPATGGQIFFQNQEITNVQGNRLRRLRRHMQVVFQDPYSSLNPRLRAGEIVREPLNRMKIFEKKDRAEKVEALFDQVGLRREQMSLFPHQFSGGQRQRIGVARALASEPDLIVLDEPVSALDVAIQAQLLNLFRRLKEKLSLTYLFISHDLGVVQYLCDHIAVMYLGVIMESAPRGSFFRSPRHPYTQTLLRAVPSIRRESKPLPLSVAGIGPSSAINPGPGCRFAARCPEAMPVCREAMPELVRVAPGHRVACHRHPGSSGHPEDGRIGQGQSDTARNRKDGD
jgi:peptide/nickel transport system ATP-binding protein